MHIACSHVRRNDMCTDVHLCMDAFMRARLHTSAFVTACAEASDYAFVHGIFALIQTNKVSLILHTVSEQSYANDMSSAELAA